LFNVLLVALLSLHDLHQVMRSQRKERIAMIATPAAQKQLPFHEVSRLFARLTGTARPHRSTLIRWTRKGIRGHRLEAEQILGRWYATPDAVEAFIRAVGTAGETAIAPAGVVRTAQVARSLAELDQKLAPRGGRRHAK
jgi:hypothetical protein